MILKICYIIVNTFKLTPIELILNVSAIKLEGISSLKSGGPHAIHGKRGKVKTPLTNQGINHLAISVSVTHSG